MVVYLIDLPLPALIEYSVNRIYRHRKTYSFTDVFTDLQHSLQVNCYRGGYVFTGICLSTGGSRSGRPPLDRAPPLGHDPSWTEIPPLYSNVRVVRILLECIPVSYKFYVIAGSS